MPTKSASTAIWPQAVIRPSSRRRSTQPWYGTGDSSNRCDLFVFANERQAILLARLDNLGKGASGAAVQSMNVHLGVDEGLGL